MHGTVHQKDTSDIYILICNFFPNNNVYQPDKYISSMTNISKSLYLDYLVLQGYKHYNLE